MSRLRIVSLGLGLVVLVVALVRILAFGGADGTKPLVFARIVPGVAVAGHDAVAYFTEGRPVPGSPEITLEHEGATWRFASEVNRATFRAEPAKFAPRYGGYCAYAVSRGYTAKGDPEAWSIVDGRLYLNYDQNVRRIWEKDTVSNIRLGDANWPAVLAQ